MAPNSRLPWNRATASDATLEGANQVDQQQVSAGPSNCFATAPGLRQKLLVGIEHQAPNRPFDPGQAKLRPGRSHRARDGGEPWTPWLRAIAACRIAGAFCRPTPLLHEACTDVRQAASRSARSPRSSRGLSIERAGAWREIRGPPARSSAPRFGCLPPSGGNPVETSLAVHHSCPLSRADSLATPTA